MAGDSMTKAALVEEVARVAELTKKHSEVIVDAVFESIINALQRGEKIELRGFGSFRLRRREPRKGRNPKTGDRVDVPSKRVPYFKPGKELKELINTKEVEKLPDFERTVELDDSNISSVNDRSSVASDTNFRQYKISHRKQALEAERFDGAALDPLETGIRNRCCKQYE